MKIIDIITVTNGNINELELTLESIDNQSFKCYRNLIISKKKIKLNKKFINKNRIFYYQKKDTIYKAMNFAIKKNAKNYALFLNAGDVFCSSSSLKKIFKYSNGFKIKKCLMMVTILKNNNHYFYPLKKIFYKKNFLTHSSFIKPPAKENFEFNINKAITADGDWMKENIKKFGIKKIYSPITIFYLGGISNLPSIRSILLKSNENFFIIFKEIIKFFLLKIIGRDFFYKLIYHFKYKNLTNLKIHEI